jgi:hypothetical protein
VHKGTPGVKPKGKTYQRVLFTLPSSHGPIIGQGLLNGTLVFGAVEFCRQIVEASQEWFDDNSTQKFVIRNSEDVFRYRPEGFAPFIGGIAVIA